MNEQEKTEIMEQVETVPNDEIDDTLVAKQTWYKNKNALYGCIVAAIVLVLAGGGTAFALLSNKSEPIQNDAASVQTVANKEQGTIAVVLNLPDWNEDSTPALIKIDDGKDIQYKAIEPKKNNLSVELKLDKGNYTVSAVSPINHDGSIYVVSDPIKVSLDDAKNEIKVPVEGTKLPAEDVTDQQISDIQSEFDKAKEQGSVDEKVTDKVKENANNGKEARESKSDEEKTEAQEEAKKQTETKQGSTNQAIATPAGNTSNNSSSNTSSPQPAEPSQPSAPSHEHSWTPVYTTVHHDAVYTQRAIYGTVCTSCGATLNTENDIVKHLKATEHHGWREGVVGYEDVLLQDAYDEQVFDHYACSCGATK